ncbi:zinc finger protein 8-like isoform X2 [Micropterus dolomieu]|uniref:zinc finger protein 8-like isoform X2 n=1 Tax=Micropterus dolomieu TaxID=147949 RepID=UPI001E8D17ED|nr:zinc finger protein 8-like isoform X2 [Micropterus dolomieu]
MSKIQMLRGFINQRLTAAAEEIFGLFERTISEYEEELCRSKEENQREPEHLDTCMNPDVQLHRADVQQLLVSKEEVPPEQQQQWSPRLDQEDPPEPPHIKQEQEELWTSQEGEQLPELEEADITKFPFTLVPVKSEEDDEEKPQSSQLHQSQTEQMETETDGKDCAGPEPARNFKSDSRLQPTLSYETSHVNKHVAEESNEDWTEARGSPSDSSYVNVLENNDVPVSDLRSSSVKKSFSCSECGRRFVHKGNLKSHMRCHTGEKPFGCSICGKRFRQNSNLVAHLRIHTAEKPFTCSVCNSSFSQQGTLGQHMRIHTGERPFSCSICGKRFTQRGSLTEHMTVHTGEKPFSCSVCGKGFNRQSHLKNHKCVCFTDAFVNINDHMLWPS